MQKKWGFIQENPQKRDFSHTWGSIQEWHCIEVEVDTVIDIRLYFVVMQYNSYFGLFVFRFRNGVVHFFPHMKNVLTVV